MSARELRAPPAPGVRPWFQQRRGLAAVVCVVLFGAVTVLRFALGDDAAIAVTMLYVLPISLAAVAWGRWAGAGAGVVGLALIGIWVLAKGVDLSILGWLSRAVPLLLIGFVLGDASERLRRAEEERSLQEARNLRLRHAVEINDSLIQGMAAAKWSLEAGRPDTGLEMLNETITEGQRLVSDLMREADASERDQP
ncbi:DUF4118 domain-containing protein [Nocardioides pelophilus]|uniref:DUF4118 domain-containing protein n=1 Tax=Nocardioides pelophilus TaxID=2172019 RepID=UPI001602E6CE|nr:DUF4118 domain-containing protein [Nocardioides pelophilus]